MDFLFYGVPYDEDARTEYHRPACPLLPICIWLCDLCLYLWPSLLRRSVPATSRQFLYVADTQTWFSLRWLRFLRRVPVVPSPSRERYEHNRHVYFGCGQVHDIWLKYAHLVLLR